MSDQASDLVAVQESQITEWFAGADEVEGYDLVKAAALESLVGVPFKITQVIFRDGIQRKGQAYRDDYVSVELTVAPPPVYTDVAHRILSRREAHKLTMQGAARPDEQLVINDGSTGIYRQITEYLDAKELITLPDGDETGEKGDSRFDLPRSEWTAGADEATEGIKVNLNCSRGLRFSDYSNDYTGDETARTWYIA